MLFHFAFGPDVDDELWAYSLDALDINRAAHLLDDFLADGQAKPSSLLISLRILVKLAKINEQLLASFLWHAYAIVDDT